MQKRVKKAEKPKHSTKSNQAMPTRDVSKWGQGKCHHQEAQCPHARFVSNFFERIRPKLAIDDRNDKPSDRQQADKKDGRL